MTEEELKDFMEYFKNELPDPEHHPQKAIWLMKWYQSIVLRNRNEDTTRIGD
jgi:hypothetical protein